MKEHDTVRVKTTTPEGIPVGSIGVIVHKHNGLFCEVEFLIDGEPSVDTVHTQYLQLVDTGTENKVFTRIEKPVRWTTDSAEDAADFRRITAKLKVNEPQGTSYSQDRKSVIDQIQEIFWSRGLYFPNTYGSDIITFLCQFVEKALEIESLNGRTHK